MLSTIRNKDLRGLNTAWIQHDVADAPIMLLLHGFPDSAASWAKQIDAFKDKFTVVAPYIRGAAPSAKAKDVRRYGPDAVALDIMGILNEVDPTHARPVIIVGHDLGAVHAWNVAELLRSRAAALIIINGLTIGQMLKRFRNPRQLLKSWYIALMQVPMLPELLVRSGPERILDMAHRLGGLAPEERPATASLRGALLGPLNQYRAFFRAAPGELTRRTKVRLTCPVLAIFGAEDAFLVRPTRNELSAEAENVTIRILPGNHWLHRSEPEKINRLIADFCASTENLP